MVDRHASGEAPVPEGERAAIEIEDLVVSYGRKRAVDGLSLTVPVGSVYGFLGPNGAGKTTTIKTLLGFRGPDGGSAKVLTNFLVCLIAAAVPLLAALWLFNRKAY